MITAVYIPIMLKSQASQGFKTNWKCSSSKREPDILYWRSAFIVRGKKWGTFYSSQALSSVIYAFTNRSVNLSTGILDSEAASETVSKILEILSIYQTRAEGNQTHFTWWASSK